MQIGITNPLREFLKWKPYTPWPEEEDPFFCWDAHRVKAGGRALLVVCNAANRFAGITAMRGADWKHLDEVCWQLIGDALFTCGFSEYAVLQYLACAGEIEFGRTHGPKAVGCMNRVVDLLLWEQCERGVQFQKALTLLANADDLGSCATRKGYGLAVDRMEEDMIAHGIDPYGNEFRMNGLPEIEGNTEQGGSEPTGGGNDETGGASKGAVDGRARRSRAGGKADGDSGKTGDKALTDEEAIAEIDAVIAQTGSEEDISDIERTINVITQILRKERGFDPSRPPAAKGLCTVCGADPRVFLGDIPFCLNCYNEMTERIMGAPHVTNDNSTLAVYGDDGIVQFIVERMITPPFASWTAREIIDESKPERHGMEVCVYASTEEDQDTTLDRLWEKTQEAVSRPSTRLYETQPGFGPIENGAHVKSGIRFARDSGWGRIADDEHGERFIVIDGERYNAEQFFNLFSGHVGFKLHWELHDLGDDLPKHWDMREEFQRRGLL